MTISQSKKTYLCVPIGLGLPLVFLGLTVLSIAMALWLVRVDQNDVVPIFLAFSLLSVSIAVTTFGKAIWRVEIKQDSIICKGLMPHHTFSLAYEKCTIGMDWHKQNGNKIWWIYLCLGRMSCFQSKNPAKRINALDCKPGFIRIMYRDEVYEELISVLPKKQRSALEISRRCAGFDKQGKII